MAINALPQGYPLNGEYKILQVLGQGGFGITYLAQDINLGHKVVIKEFLPQSMAARDQSHYTVSPYREEDSVYKHLMKRFINEARLLVKIRHPNVVKVTRLFESNDTAYFVMDYEEGETLEDYLKRNNRLEETDIIAIVMPILEGAKYIHKKGVLHRDIAPDNIYLKSNGMPMLIDFGAARNAIAQKSQTLSAIAKDGYSPPEQYTPNTDQNAATDIYALGAVMYRMITGNKPANATQRQMALLKGEMDPIGDLVANYQNKYSKAFLQAVMQALNIQQEKRPQTIEALQKAIAGEVIANDSNNGKRKDGQDTGGNGRGWVVGFLATLVIVGVVGYFVQNSQAKADPTPPSKSETYTATAMSKQSVQGSDIEAAAEAKKRREVEKERLAEIQKRKDELAQLKRDAEAAKQRAHQEIERLRQESKERAQQKEQPKTKTVSFSDNGIDVKVNYPSFVKAGRKFTLTVEMYNNYGNAKQGGLTLSFPDMSSMSGNVIKSNFSKVEGYSYPKKIYNKQARRGIPAKYFMVEGWQNKIWRRGYKRYFSVELTAPTHLSKFRVYARGVLWIKNKRDIREIPSNSYTYDQQGFGVKEFTIEVKL
jgi:serine/threonine protein kinase